MESHRPQDGWRLAALPADGLLICSGMLISRPLSQVTVPTDSLLW